MIHFKPSAFFRLRSPAQPHPHPVLPSTGIARAYGRADHARMLAHAAARRLAAQDLARAGDADYWKACAPAALAKAARIRSEAGFARLP